MRVTMIWFDSAELLAPPPRLRDQRAELGIDGGDIHRADARHTEALAATAAPAAGLTGFTKTCHRNVAGDAKAARNQLGAYRQAVVDGEIGKPGFAMPGTILHHGGAQIAAGEPPGRREIGHAIVYV